METVKRNLGAQMKNLAPVLSLSLSETSKGRHQEGN